MPRSISKRNPVLIGLGALIVLTTIALLTINHHTTYEIKLPGVSPTPSFGQAMHICTQESAGAIDWSQEVVVSVRQSRPGRLWMSVAEWPRSIEKTNDAPLPSPDMEFNFTSGKVSVRNRTLSKIGTRPAAPSSATNVALCKAIARAFRDIPAPCDDFVVTADTGVGEYHVFVTRLPFMPGGDMLYTLSTDYKTVVTHPGA